MSEGYSSRDAGLNIIIKLGSTESIKAFVCETDCVAFISKQALQHEWEQENLAVLSIKGLELKRKFYQVSSRGELSGNASLFIKTLRG